MGPFLQGCPVCLERGEKRHVFLGYENFFKNVLYNKVQSAVKFAGDVGVSLGNWESNGWREQI